MEIDQKSIAEYFETNEPAENCQKWFGKIPRIEQWIMEDIVIPKKVLRLRCYLNSKTHIEWISTASVWNYLLKSGKFCEVPECSKWITSKEYVDTNGLLDKYKKLLKEKIQIYKEWSAVSLDMGNYAGKVYLDAFKKAGYDDPKKVKFPFSMNGKEEVEIDVYTAKGKLKLGIQVKNITTEVITDPKGIRKPPSIYSDLTRQFEFCKQSKIVPVLIAPFIDKRFYNFTKRYQGLHDQTFLQLFSLDYADLCKAIDDNLSFGYVRAVKEAPEHVIDWINKIPDMWNKRYCK